MLVYLGKTFRGPASGLLQEAWESELSNRSADGTTLLFSLGLALLCSVDREVESHHACASCGTYLTGSYLFAYTRMNCCQLQTLSEVQ
jgi:hypothetical protein